MPRRKPGVPPGKRGGVRPGAGRPRNADRHPQAVAEAEAKLTARLLQIIDSALALTEGIWVEETTPDGVRRIYKKPPNIKAIIYCIDRIMGKPTERKEIGIDRLKGYEGFDPDEV